MSFTVFNTRKANEDILKASLWYEEQKLGLGLEFIDDVEQLLIFLENQPEIFQKKHGAIREAPLKKFPYVVLFRVEKPDSVTVFAFFHTSKDPAKKMDFPLKRL
ncbi:MAG: type II toxin-antitoxin system RelE/ParE family toxin [Flavobacteriales bacterium]|nr:type II toxin-antitoxin system RelE/ParE family toxin [Flavobacteriales bacterium]